MNRKSKLAHASRARRHRLFICCLSSTLGFASPFAFICPNSSAFDAPPAQTSARVALPTSDQRADSSQALKRVGIRFVDPAAANRGKMVESQNRDTPQKTFKLVQTPIGMPGSAGFAGQASITDPNQSGVRIRIPSESNTSKVAVQQGPSASVASKSPESLKLTIGNSALPDVKFNGSQGPKLVGTGFASPSAITPKAETGNAVKPTFGLPPAVASNAVSPAIVPPTISPPTISRPTISPPSIATPTMARPALLTPSSAAPTIVQSPLPLPKTTSPVAQSSQPTTNVSTVTRVPADSVNSNSKQNSVSMSAMQVRINGETEIAPPALSGSNSQSPQMKGPTLTLNPAPTPTKQTPSTPNIVTPSIVSPSQPAATASRSPSIVKIPGMTVAAPSSANAASINAQPKSDLADSSKTTTAPSVSNAIAITTTPSFTNTDSSYPLATIPNPPAEAVRMRGVSDGNLNPSQEFNKLPNPNEISNGGGYATSKPSLPANTLQRVAPPRNEETIIASMPNTVQSPISAPRLTDPAARQPTRFEPSIVPVALSLNSTQSEPDSNNDSLELGNTEQVPANGSSPSAKPGTAVAGTMNTGSTNRTTLGLHENLSRAQVNSGSIDVVLKNVQIVKLQGAVRHVKVENDEICQAIVTESNCVTVIGASAGESKLAIWTNENGSGDFGAQVFRVHVRETWGEGAKNAVSIDDANRSILTLFPDSTVQIKSNADGSLTVHGKTTSNDSAKQIIMLVRKMFLVPVQDRIAVAAL